LDLNQLHKNISVLIIGNELLDGRVVDTNSNWIGFELRRQGRSISRIISCIDSIEHIKSSLGLLLNDSDVVIVSGGLGPTTDDLTREAVASFFNVSLKQDTLSLNHVEEYFAKRNRAMSETNMRQTMLPAGAAYIANPIGSAPGFYFKKDFHGQEKLLFALPGVPAELKQMCLDTVFPLIEKSLGKEKNFHELGFRVFGMAESEIGARIEALNLSNDIEICYRSAFPEIEVLFRHPEKSILDDTLLVASKAIGNEFIISFNPSTSLPEVLKDLCCSKNITVSVAESCTGGMLGELLTTVPGSSSFFKGGVLSYSNEIKEKILHVPSELLKSYGAVSSEVAKAMAEGVLQITGSNIGVSITGIAGPDGGSEEKPVGTVFLGIADSTGAETKKISFPSSRDRIRRYSSFVAMDLIRRKITQIYD